MAEQTEGAPARPRILYVEDDPFLREWMTFELAQEHYRVVTAEDGETGLAVALAANAFDMILLDVSLPGMTGFDICRALRRHADAAEVPVIFLTARSELADRLTGFDAGGVDYLAKPFAMAELKARIRALLHQSRWSERRGVARLSAEMDDAAQLQQALMPQDLPAVSGLSLYGACRPARRTSGDFYDFVAEEGDLHLMAADVSGKGLPAALIMTSVRSALRAALPAAPEPAAALQTVGANLYGDLSDVEKFVTAFAATYSATGRRVRYASAGYSLVVVCPAGGAPQILEPDGPPLGVLAAFPYQSGEVTLGPGDLLVLCSDGIFEASDAAGNRFGHERLLTTLASLADQSAGAIGDGIFDAVAHFTGQTEQTDDQTVLVCKGVDDVAE